MTATSHGVKWGRLTKRLRIQQEATGKIERMTMGCKEMEE
jgi:hypothetical protein